jgi:hypothetical protein
VTGLGKEKLTMDKNRSSQGAIALSTRNLKSLFARLCLVALLVASGLASLLSTASAQQSCLDQCAQAYVQCLYNANGDPAMEAICDDRYDECCEDCLLQ